MRQTRIRRGASARSRAGFRVFEIGRVVEREVRRDGFSSGRDLCGMASVGLSASRRGFPNCPDPRAKSLLTEGLVMHREPRSIAAGTGRQFLDADGWTVRTADRMPAAHYEHTIIVITKGAPILLTA